MIILKYQMLKKFFIRAVAGTLRGLVKLKNWLVSFHAKFVFRVLRASGGWFLRWLVMPFYKTYLFSKRQFLKIYEPDKNKFWQVVSHRYLIHALIIVIGLSVIANNINAQIKNYRDEDFGKKSILYALSGGDELGYIEERATGDTSVTTPATKYLGYDAGLSADFTDQYPLDILPEEDLGATTQGGTAIIKPDISPFEDNNVRQLHGEAQEYIVQPGDTLGSLAEKFGVSINTILWENNLSTKSTVRPGDKLTILPTTGIKHTVKKNQTLDQIARLYGVDKNQILTYNDIDNEGSLRVGQEILIPGGKKLPTAPIYQQPSTPQGPGIYNGTKPANVMPSGTRMQWPTSGHRITQYYGWRHTGLDIDGDYSSPLYAAEAGTVIKAETDGWNGGYGRMVIIDHGGGIQTLYGHMNKLFVKVGDKVNRGQTIGMMGTTGRSTGTHLHFEVRVGGRRLNPLSYIR